MVLSFDKDGITEKVLNDPKLLKSLQDRAKLSRVFLTDVKDIANIFL